MNNDDNATSGRENCQSLDDDQGLQDKMQDQSFRKTLFFSRRFFNFLPDLKRLLDAYQDQLINARDDKGNTGLSIATRSNARDVLVYFLWQRRRDQQRQQ